MCVVCFFGGVVLFSLLYHEVTKGYIPHKAIVKVSQVKDIEAFAFWKYNYCERIKYIYDTLYVGYFMYWNFMLPSSYFLIMHTAVTAQKKTENRKTKLEATLKV